MNATSRTILPQHFSDLLQVDVEATPSPSSQTPITDEGYVSRSSFVLTPNSDEIEKEN